MEHHDRAVLVGVSSCLLGEQVRYDGGHKRDAYVNDVLADHFTFVPVCPEVEVGMGVPRETVQLVDRGGDIRMIGHDSGKDHTAAMRRYAGRRVTALLEMGISGYVLKARSPSCGMQQVPTHTEQGGEQGSGRGLFADALITMSPSLPVEEEGRLDDPELRESFIARVFAYSRLTRLFADGWTSSDLAAFHGAEESLLMAHDPEACEKLGRMVADAISGSRAPLRHAYVKGFMTALEQGRDR